MVSGYYISKKIEIEASIPKSFYECFLEALQYTFKRIISLYPFYFVATVIAILLNYFTNHNIKVFAAAIGDLLFLHCFGFRCATATGIVWYLCSFYLGMLIVYTFSRKYTEFFFIVSPLIFLTITGSIVRLFGKMDVPGEYVACLNCGLLRAISGMAAGFFIYRSSHYIRTNLKATKAIEAFIGGTEILVWTVVIVYMSAMNDEMALLDSYITVFIAIGLVISYSGRGIPQEWFSNSFIIIGGKASSILFMTHYPWLRFVEKYLMDYSITFRYSFAIVLSIVTALFVWWAGNKAIRVVIGISNMIMVKNI